MSRRPRKHIALREKLAAALAELLPVPLWEEMRRERATAKEVIELFAFDTVPNGALLTLREKLAWALSMLLPVPLRLEMRREGATAKEYIGLFEFDHVVLHSMGGSDLWWNLKATIRELHREKSRTDTKIAAKSKRLVRREAEHRAKMTPEEKFFEGEQWTVEQLAGFERAKRKIQSRGFSKQHRPMRWRRAP